MLAVVESNESLQPYEIKSQIAGRVTERDIALGEFVTTEKPIYVVADLSNVWVDLNVPRADFEQLHEGQKALLERGAGAVKCV